MMRRTIGRIESGMAGGRYVRLNRAGRRMPGQGGAGGSGG